jgi:peptidoglycan/LPS O-acetylase OafA/YrhL
LTLRRSILINPWLAHIAKYSYSMYLWHLVPHVFGQPILQMAARRAASMVVLVKCLYIPCLFVVTYLIARVSWAAIEKPFLSLKDVLYASPTALRE